MTLCDLEYKGATVGYRQLSWLLVAVRWRDIITQYKVGDERTFIERNWLLINIVKEYWYWYCNNCCHIANKPGCGAMQIDVDVVIASNIYNLIWYVIQRSSQSLFKLTYCNLKCTFSLFLRWRRDSNECVTHLAVYAHCLVTFVKTTLSKTRNTFCGTWYLPHSRVHKSIAELCSNFGDSAITKGQIAYFSLRMRKTVLFLLSVKIWRHHRVRRPGFPIRCRNFGDSSINMGQIAYFSSRMRETPIILLPVKNLTSPSCSPTPISYNTREFWRYVNI